MTITTREELVEAMRKAVDAEYDAIGFQLKAGPSRLVAQAALKAIEDAGYMVVPVKPCHDMTGAVLEPGEDRTKLVKDFKAMLPASPMAKEG
ncbi:hypothetical protein INR77_09110 [Erythrobacter sp. SCSIO 43205]|uniref:hypothetical protein n=1 Tax=Erythrobacter sp. SCSIO 43205 TaxID=2779361 RepID=UPI001CA93B61|nr:hypothetical protein [Erythrobacter sp. SCSIO 43205]UAB77005.1 hypothetical protein INR77_09110 [Erythrobacter sp. SCSIO 43205]